ncbi:hypothetical protein LCGC14_2626330 [marine sediment metagenome]|uniref:LysM domain-containing protein n=1 Tax=marine sediment metagenome TaxID=412755 RepID=A0A0F9A1N3_9ZZZZ
MKLSYLLLLVILGCATKPVEVVPAPAKKLADSTQDAVYARPYIVQHGDWLSKIALAEYGDPRAWILIFHDNRGTMRGVGNLRIGSNLRVRRG